MDYVGNPLLTCLFLACFGFSGDSRYDGTFHVPTDWYGNFVLSIPVSAIVRLAMLPIPIAIAIWARQQQIGLLN